MGLAQLRRQQAPAGGGVPRFDDELRLAHLLGLEFGQAALEQQLPAANDADVGGDALNLAEQVA